MFWICLAICNSHKNARMNDAWHIMCITWSYRCISVRFLLAHQYYPTAQQFWMAQFILSSNIYWTWHLAIGFHWMFIVYQYIKPVYQKKEKRPCLYHTKHSICYREQFVALLRTSNTTTQNHGSKLTLLIWDKAAVTVFLLQHNITQFCCSCHVDLLILKAFYRQFFLSSRS